MQIPDVPVSIWHIQSLVIPTLQSLWSALEYIVLVCHLKSEASNESKGTSRPKCREWKSKNSELEVVLIYDGKFVETRQEDRTRMSHQEEDRTSRMSDGASLQAKSPFRGSSSCRFDVFLFQRLNDTFFVDQSTAIKLRKLPVWSWILLLWYD